MVTVFISITMNNSSSNITYSPQRATKQNIQKHPEKADNNMSPLHGKRHFQSHSHAKVPTGNMGLLNLFHVFTQKNLSLSIYHVLMEDSRDGKF